MGAAGALELAGNLPAFEDWLIHPCKNIQEIDPQCELNNLVKSEPIKKEVTRTDLIAKMRVQRQKFSWQKAAREMLLLYEEIFKG